MEDSSSRLPGDMKYERLKYLNQIIWEQEVYENFKWYLAYINNVKTQQFKMFINDKKQLSIGVISLDQIYYPFWNNIFSWKNNKRLMFLKCHTSM